jgi:hypothetical protein
MTEHQPPGEGPPEGDVPPWIISTPAPRGRARRDPIPRHLVLIVAGLAAVLLVVGGAGFLLLRRSGGDDSQAGGVVEPTPVVTTPPIESTYLEPTYAQPTPEADPEGEALAQLDELARQGLTRVTLDGRYAAQLASKTPGITDPHQTAADGTHVFQATDILHEHLSLRDDPRNGEATVVLLRSSDYGKRQLYDGQPLYVTFALRDFRGAQAVRAWCARRFAGLSGETLENQCAVRRLRPAS